MSGSERDKDTPPGASGSDDQPTTPYPTPKSAAAVSAWDSTAPSWRQLATRFEILGELGRGGMGIVLKARDRETGEVVALKALKPEIAADSAVVERFKNELRLARKITHKNVCRTYDLHRFGEVAVIAMEYVEGESLRQGLRRYAPLSVRKGTEFGRQICGALAEAHAQGIVHRDLKPENVMLDESGQIKVMDFGIARSVDVGTTATGSIVGTPAYMAPEQAVGKPVDHRADIYALGLMLYEMFTGALPFGGDSPVAVAFKQVHETPPRPRELEPTLPEHIEQAILKCLEKDPAQRFKSVAELEAALTATPTPQPVAVEAREIALPAHLTRWQRSDWLLVAAAVVGLALFFPSFNRTSLAPRSKVTFDRSAFLRLAREYSQRLGAPLVTVRSIFVKDSDEVYDYVAKRGGPQAALELANGPVRYWEWGIRGEEETSPGELSLASNIRMDNRGALTRFRSFSQGMGPSEKVSLEQGKPLAEKALSDFLNCDPTHLTFGNAKYDDPEHLNTSFNWFDSADYHGLRKSYSVSFVGRQIGALEDSFVFLPDSPVQERADWLLLVQVAPMPSFLFLVLLPLGLLQRHRVDLSARWRVLTSICAFVACAWFLWGVETEVGPAAFLWKVFSVFLGLAGGLLAFCVSVALERAIRKAGGEKVASLPRLFDRSSATEPCGLSILRGSLLGVAVLGLDTSLVWVGNTFLGMRLDSTTHIVLRGAEFLISPLSGVGVAIYALFNALVIVTVVVFFTCVLTRWFRRRHHALLLGAALSALCLVNPAITLGAVQPYDLKLILLFADCLVLVWTFARFDLLTLGWAAFTFALCWENYTLLVMFEPIGSVQQWVAFAIWGVVVLGAAAITFQSSLRAAQRRLAAALE